MAILDLYFFSLYCPCLRIVILGKLVVKLTKILLSYSKESSLAGICKASALGGVTVHLRWPSRFQVQCCFLHISCVRSCRLLHLSPSCKNNVLSLTITIKMWKGAVVPKQIASLTPIDPSNPFRSWLSLEKKNHKIFVEFSLWPPYFFSATFLTIKEKKVLKTALKRGVFSPDWSGSSRLFELGKSK